MSIKKSNKFLLLLLCVVFISGIAVIIIPLICVTRFDSKIIGDGISGSDIKTVSSFNSINIQSGFAVKINLQKNPEVLVEGDRNLLSLVKTEVKESTLYIIKEKDVSSKDKIRVTIGAEDIRNIVALGANEIEINDIDNNEFCFTQYGAGEFTASGQTQRLVIDCNGAGQINAQNLLAKEVDIQLKGAGEANINVKDKLNAAIFGVGEIKYYGEPERVRKNISGIGEIKRIGVFK